MRILAFDTSSRAGSAALLDDDRLIAAHQLDVSATHSERLLPAVDRLLADAGWTVATSNCSPAPKVRAASLACASASRREGNGDGPGLPLVGVNSLEATALALAFGAPISVR